MSATKVRPATNSRSSRRRSPTRRAKPPEGLVVSRCDRAPRSPAVELELAPVAALVPEAPAARESWWEAAERIERARAVRLSPMWQMTPSQRVDAMRRGRLSYEQLAAWSSRHPEQVPLVNGEYEWLVALTPEVCE